MRSFPVRTAILLAALLPLAVLFLRQEKPDVYHGAPPPADRRTSSPGPPAFARSLLSAPPTQTANPSAEDSMIAAYRTRIADVDRDTSGFFQEELDRVLSDTGQSVAIEDFRLPVRDGMTSVMDAFPGGPADGAEEQRNLAVVYVASALHGCATPADCQHRIDELTARCPWVVAYASQQ